MMTAAIFLMLSHSGPGAARAAPPLPRACGTTAAARLHAALHGVPPLPRVSALGLSLHADPHTTIMRLGLHADPHTKA